MHAIILKVVASMAKGSYIYRTRRSGRRVRRGAHVHAHRLMRIGELMSMSTMHQRTLLRMTM